MNPKSLLMGIPKVRLLLSWKSWIEYIMKVSKVPLVVKAFDPNGTSIIICTLDLFPYSPYLDRE